VRNSQEQAEGVGAASPVRTVMTTKRFASISLAWRFSNNICIFTAELGAILRNYIQINTCMPGRST
jgi:hypothetical protein